MVIGVKLYEYAGTHALTNQVASRHTKRKKLQYWDAEKKTSRALRYATNQESIFVDEQKGDILTEEIVFDHGQYRVPDDNPVLQRFMDMHPDNVKNGGQLFQEHDPVAESVAIMKDVMEKREAMNIFIDMDDKEKVAYLRNYLPTRVDKMAKSEIDVAIANRVEMDPEKFIEMNQDPDVGRKNTINEAIAANIIQWKKAKSQVNWNLGTRNSIICRIPEGENPEDALERYLMSNDGKESFIEIERAVEDK